MTRADLERELARRSLDTTGKNRNILADRLNAYEVKRKDKAIHK